MAFWSPLPSALPIPLESSFHLPLILANTSASLSETLPNISGSRSRTGDPCFRGYRRRSELDIPDDSLPLGVMYAERSLLFFSSSTVLAHEFFTLLSSLTILAQGFCIPSSRTGPPISCAGRTGCSSPFRSILAKPHANCASPDGASPRPPGVLVVERVREVAASVADAGLLEFCHLCETQQLSARVALGRPLLKDEVLELPAQLHFPFRVSLRADRGQEETVRVVQLILLSRPWTRPASSASGSTSECRQDFLSSLFLILCARLHCTSLGS